MEIKNTNKLKTEKELYFAIRAFEFDAGEDFLDQNCSLLDKGFYRFLLDNNHISQNRYSQINKATKGYFDQRACGYDDDGELLFYAECEMEAWSIVYLLISRYALTNKDFYDELIDAIFNSYNSETLKSFQFGNTNISNIEKEYNFAVNHSLRECQEILFSRYEKFWQDRLDSDYKCREHAEERLSDIRKNRERILAYDM